MLRIDTSALDYLIIGLYFVTVLGVGFLARRLIKSDLDFFLSGRSLPAWITGLAFISANLGALEIHLRVGCRQGQGGGREREPLGRASLADRMRCVLGMGPQPAAQPGALGAGRWLTARSRPAWTND